MKLDEEKIRKQAKAIMDEFIKALEKVEEEGKAGIERKETTRIPEESEKDEGFREKMFKNAPKKKRDYIVAERKSW